MLPASARRLICGSHRCGKTTLLAEAAASYLHSGSDSGKLVALSAHRHAGRTLRAAMHEQTGQELPAADVRRRATALLEQFPTAAGLPAGWSRIEVVSALDRRVLMRRAWAAVAATDSLYAKYSARPGALDWLAGIFDLFAEWSGTADPDLLAGPAPRDSVLVELWSAYRHYLGLCRQLQLVAFQEVVPRALDVLRHKDVHARAVPDLLLLDDLDLFRPSELLFVQALIEPATAVVASAAMAPSARSPDPQVRFLDRWCAALSLRQEHPASAEASCVPPYDYTECRSPEHEADTIAREIVTSFGPDSRFADYAIICFDPELIPVLRRTLPQWSIAVEGMDARDAFLPAIAPLLHLGMRLIAGTPTTAAELAGYLWHPGVGLQTGDAHMLAAESGGGAISADPIVLLEEQARACSTAAGRQRLRQIVDVTFMLRATEWSPSLKLQRWLEVLDCAAVTTAFVAAGAEQWELRADADLVERWLGFLGRSERLRTALGEPLSDPDAVDVLVGSQALVEPIARPLADAVRILQPDQLGGCSTPTVWLAGLHEHPLPQRSAALAWVPPETFAELGWLPGFVPPMKDDRAARWDQGLRSLERATGRATRRLGFSWSQTDERGHRRLR
ncbi:MAG TPA: hypothetical protein VEZ12_04305, partial [Herpetosiphonaceae bacterium]|nr:hypothetical protein [Herpetosiphonaceae bacterium]